MFYLKLKSLLFLCRFGGGPPATTLNMCKHCKVRNCALFCAVSDDSKSRYPVCNLHSNNKQLNVESRQEANKRQPSQVVWRPKVLDGSRGGSRGWIGWLTPSPLPLWGCLNLK